MTIPSRKSHPAALIAVMALLTGPTHAQGTATPPYLNTKLPAAERAADLVHRMTLR